MKCMACQYTDYTPLCSNSFIKLAITTKITPYIIDTPVLAKIQDYDSIHTEINYYELFACPRCGTIRIEKD